MLKDMKEIRMKDKQFANSEQVMEYAMADFEFLTGKRSFQERQAYGCESIAPHIAKIHSE